MSGRVEARYWIETAYPVEHAAQVMAGEQSTGTFVRVAGETDELREGHAARVEEIVELGKVSAPSLPGRAKVMRRFGIRLKCASRGRSPISVLRCQTSWRRLRGTCSS
jgi:hypothetical protein